MDGSQVSVGMLGFMLGVVLMTLLLSTYDTRYTATHSTIVSHGCAQYNPQTSEFEWLDTLSIPADGVSTCVP